MELEQSTELAAIREAVVSGLREQAYFDSCKYTTVLQYLALPFFGNPRSWDVLRQTRGEAIVVTRTCWRFDLDVAAFSSPVERARHPRPFQPTIETSTLDVDVEALQAALDRLSRVSIPLKVAETAMGIDGVFYEMQFGSGWASCRFCWWYRIPECWSAVGEFVEEMTRLCEYGEEFRSKV